MRAHRSGFDHSRWLSTGGVPADISCSVGERRPVAALQELVKVSRRLPLESVALRVALLFLALDTLSESRRWTLGPLGAIELDTEFTPVGTESDNGIRRATTRGRLCAPDGFTVDTEIMLTTRDGAEPRLTLRTDPVSEMHRDELLVAARAGLDELAEELLFFGTR
jgi:hypothetical protein